MISIDDGYPALAGVIDFARFDYDKNTYKDQERTILQPQLETLGYTNITWSDGERDSFGPLSRLCKAKGPDKVWVTFIYG
ncbi:MAG: hypothetical protein ABWY25_07555 [Paenisporosarcina sp.]